MNTIYFENSNIFFLSSLVLCFESFPTKSHSRKQFVKTKFMFVVHTSLDILFLIALAIVEYSRVINTP